MIIEAKIGGHDVHHIYVDGGSSSEVIFEQCFSLLLQRRMVPYTTSLVVFSGETRWPLGHVEQPVKIGDVNHSTTALMNFVVVNATSPHNAIIGRTCIRQIRAIPSMAH